MARRRIPVVTFIADTVRSAFDDRFLDVGIGDYETYHGEIQTGNMARARAFAEWIEPGSRVLDIGCGDGTVGKFLMDERNAKVSGVDVAQAAVDKCAKLGIPAVVRNLNEEPLGDLGRFDYVLISEVLEHLVYPQKVLNEAVGLAEKGVIVSIPNSGFIAHRLQMANGIFPRQSFTHLHHWTRDDFHKWCRLLGLRVLRERVGPDEGPLARAWPNMFGSQLVFLVGRA